jgi:hypothetical protein
MELEDTSDSAAPAKSPVEPLMNPKQIDAWAFQRKVLDWRDSAHAETMSSLVTLHREFTRHIDNRLGDIGFFSGLFANPANEVLTQEFVQRVQTPMNACLHRQEAALNAIAEKEVIGQKSAFRFRTADLADPYACLSGLDFKPSERNAIIETLHVMLLETGGLATDLCNQATRMADQLIQKRQAC